MPKLIIYFIFCFIFGKSCTAEAQVCLYFNSKEFEQQINKKVYKSIIIDKKLNQIIAINDKDTKEVFSSTSIWGFSKRESNNNLFYRIIENNTFLILEINTNIVLYKHIINHRIPLSKAVFTNDYKSYFFGKNYDDPVFKLEKDYLIEVYNLDDSKKTALKKILKEYSFFKKPYTNFASKFENMLRI
jgi:hypothetical protein